MAQLSLDPVQPQEPAGMPLDDTNAVLATPVGVRAVMLKSTLTPCADITPVIVMQQYRQRPVLMQLCLMMLYCLPCDSFLCTKANYI